MKPKNVEDIYPLSPMQQGMLFHTRCTPDSALYFVQWAAILRGDLHIPAFQEAWQATIDQHPALRTLFIWEGLPIPLQVVRQYVRASWVECDWRHLAEARQRDQVAALLMADQSHGFDLTRAPLMCLHLIRLADDVYQFIWSFHHLLMDGWAIALVLKETFARYAASCSGAAFEPAPTQPYREYIAWLQRQDLALAEQFWRTELQGFTAPTPFVVDQPYQASAGLAEHGERYDILPAPETAQLQAFARVHQLTLSSLVHGAWALLLSRYSGAADVVFGSVVAGRPVELAGAETMIGLFLNTLPVRVRIPPDATLLPWLQALQAQQAEARQYEYSPLAQVQGWSAVGHGLPLFESLLSFENYPAEWLALDSPALQVDGGRPIERTNYPLNLSVIPGPEVSLKVIYDTRRFDAATIERLVRHLKTLLMSMVVDPDQRLVDVALLTAAERQQLLVGWNATAADYPHDRCLHELFEAQVERTPNATAAVFGDQRLTYRELNQRANQLAQHLRRGGVGPEALVGLCVERSLDMLVGLLGILKAGGAYLPLDPVYPAERLAFMLEDAQVAALVTQTSLLDRLPWASAGLSQGAIVCLDRDWASIATASTENIASGATPADLAYVIYTSGSTGRPKGTLVEHRGIGNLAAAQICAFGVRPDSRVLQFASLSFDAALSEIVMTLLAGATLCLAPQEALLPGPGLLSLLRDQAITVVTLPPLALAALPPDQLPALRTIAVAGETCPLTLAARWAPGRRFLNAYGPTETTVCATMFKYDGVRLPIGRPIANTQIYLLDDRLQPVPVGVPGELYIGGIGLARGYHNRPELTAERFVPNPFGTMNEERGTMSEGSSASSFTVHCSSFGERLYKTGDLARYLPDGTIEFLGRADHQVKLRGFRIELGEIEAALLRHPAVGEAAVILRPLDATTAQHSDSDRAQPVASPKQRLVAYVTPRAVPATDDQVELWPSVAEYFVYDELLYGAMTNDERRNQSYRVALERTVRDKVVVEIGAGKDAILARLCVEAGAKRVYTIELLEETYHQAKACIEQLGLANRITIIHGDATKVQLPELADICVSEIVGAIGGSEGAAAIINNAQRFLKADGIMIPQRSVTQIAAVRLPEELRQNPGFAELPGYYVKRIFEQVGYPFDLRVCLKNLPRSNIASDAGVFEDLDFTAPIALENRHAISLTVTEDTSIDGFLVWLNLHTTAGELIDILEHQHCWLPVYLPVFYPGVAVARGDTIRMTISRTLCDNQLNPDYQLRGTIIRRDGSTVDFDYDAFHYKPSFRENGFYQALFDERAAAAGARPHLSIATLKEHLRRSLPEYMIPTTIIALDAMPLTPNGKLDRVALPVPSAVRPELAQAFVRPQTAVEQSIAALWREILQTEQIGLHDNFFDLGGHSLVLAQIHSQVQQMFDSDLSLVEMFKYPTVYQLARRLSQEPVEQPDPVPHGDREVQCKAGRSRMQQRRALQHRRM
jgi:amino acid adenylation domain-containing protein